MITSSIQIFTLEGSQKKREKGVENTFKVIIAENFPNLRKEIDVCVQEARESRTGSAQRGTQQDAL